MEQNISLLIGLLRNLRKVYKGEQNFVKNKYVIEGNIVRITLNRRDGNDLETIIDLEDLERVLNFKYSWCAAFLIEPKDYYAHSTVYKGLVNGVPKNTTIGLQCFILGLEGKDGFYVDHINHNSLDNRKENLRVTTMTNNTRHRGSINSNNTSGYRNISLINKKYTVQLQVDGKNKILGRFENIDDAIVCAEEMRNKYYGEFSGVSK